VNVAICSMFRDSCDYLSRYIRQVQALRERLEHRGDTLRVVAVENDSADDTFLRLDDWGANVYADLTLVGVSDDCPYYPSVDDPVRWRHHAWVANHALAEIDERDDVVLYVESDLKWEADHLLKLIDEVGTLDAVSCPNWAHEPHTRYYDIWGSRRNGVAFTPYPPYHADFDTDLLEMDSVASVLAVKADIARKTRFQPEDAFVGWCRDIREQGHTVWLDPSVWVVHP
jgi:hypothetical protein